MVEPEGITNKGRGDGDGSFCPFIVEEFAIDGQDAGGATLDEGGGSVGGDRRDMGVTNTELLDFMGELYPALAIFTVLLIPTDGFTVD